MLVVTRLDRLARPTRDLLNILDTIAKAGAGFRSLADTWADTTTPRGRLMLTVLALAEFKRELMRARTGEGRKRAKESGVRFGRPHKLTPHQRQEALARREAGETLMDIARSYGVSHRTISRLLLAHAFSIDMLVETRWARERDDRARGRRQPAVRDCLRAHHRSGWRALATMIKKRRNGSAGIHQRG